MLYWTVFERRRGDWRWSTFVESVDELKFYPWTVDSGYTQRTTAKKKNTHTHTGKEDGRLMSVETPFTATFMVLAFIVGTAKNSLVIFAILYQRRLRNIPNYFIFSLALSGMLTDYLAVPLRLVEARMDFLQKSNSSDFSLLRFVQN